MRRIHRVRGAGQQHIGHDVRELAALDGVEAALRDPWRANADAAGVEGVLVAGDGVAVDDDADDIQDARGLVAAERRAVRALDAGDIHVEHVAVGAAEGHAQAAFLELIHHGLGVLDGLRLQLLEQRCAGELEGERQGGEDVDVRSALFAGEHGLVQFLGDIGVGGEAALRRAGHPATCGWWT